MIDAREPKNGDFVAYVEQFVRLPQGMVVPPELRSPGQVLGRGGFVELAKRLERGPAPRAIEPAGNAWGHSPQGRTPARVGSAPRSPAAAGPPDIEEIARTAARALARLGRRFASILLLAGLALIALSFADQDFIPIDPVPGVGLVAAGAILRRIASKVA